jgi:plastocyanin
MILFTLFPGTSAGQDRSAQAAGSIEGMITGPANDDVGEEMLRERLLGRYAVHAHSASEQIQPYKLSEKAVIYVEDIEEPDSDRSSAVHPRLNQFQMMFRPLVLPVEVGTSVDFPNNDNLYHNVFSYSQPKEFDLGRYPTGQKRTVTFERPGIIKVYCDIHSHMYATILVLRNRYFAVPDDDGHFSITGIPAGTHRVAFWYGRKLAGTKSVTIKDGGVAILDFSY